MQLCLTQMVTMLRMYARFTIGNMLQPVAHYSRPQILGKALVVRCVLFILYSVMQSTLTLQVWSPNTFMNMLTPDNYHCTGTYVWNVYMHINNHYYDSILYDM